MNIIFRVSELFDDDNCGEELISLKCIKISKKRNTENVVISCIYLVSFFPFAEPLRVIKVIDLSIKMKGM